MNGAMQKMNDAVERMADGMISLELKMKDTTGDLDSLKANWQKFSEGMVSLELKMEETTGKLNALIDTVDGIIRKTN